MGIFSYLFGTRSTYSVDMKSLPREQIRLLVSRSRVRTLDADEEEIVEKIIEQARSGGKISLRKIDDALRLLVGKNKISINDKQGLMKQFETYFEK
jgi:hypothetical protein